MSPDGGSRGSGYRCRPPSSNGVRGPHEDPNGPDRVAAITPCHPCEGGLPTPGGSFAACHLSSASSQSLRIDTSNHRSASVVDRHVVLCPGGRSGVVYVGSHLIDEAGDARVYRRITDSVVILLTCCRGRGAVPISFATCCGTPKQI